MGVRINALKHGFFIQNVVVKKSRIFDFRFFFLIFGHCFGLGSPILLLYLLLEQPQMAGKIGWSHQNSVQKNHKSKIRDFFTTTFCMKKNMF